MQQEHPSESPSAKQTRLTSQAGVRADTLAGYTPAAPSAPSHAKHSGIERSVLRDYRCGGSVGMVFLFRIRTDFPFNSTNDDLVET